MALNDSFKALGINMSTISIINNLILKNTAELTWLMLLNGPFEEFIVMSLSKLGFQYGKSRAGHFCSGDDFWALSLISTVSLLSVSMGSFVATVLTA